MFLFNKLSNTKSKIEAGGTIKFYYPNGVNGMTLIGFSTPNREKLYFEDTPDDKGDDKKLITSGIPPEDASIVASIIAATSDLAIQKIRADEKLVIFRFVEQ